MIRLQKLRNDLKSARENLEETQQDRYLSETKEFLNDLADSYEDLLTSRLDDIDTLVSHVIDAVNRDTDVIQKTLEAEAESVGYTITNVLADVFGHGGVTVSNYNKKFETNYTAIAQSVANIESLLANAAAHSDTVTHTKLQGLASGTKNSKHGLFWTNENAETIVRKSDGAILTRLNVGDMVLPNAARNNFWNMMTDPGKFFSGFDVTGSSATNNVTMNLSLTLPNVKNYDEFKDALKKDPKFESFVQEITLGRLAGRPKLAKYA